MSLQYYVLDIETTGFSPDKHEITEVGIVRVKDKTQFFKHVRCDFPERASLDSLRITNKTLEDLAVGESKEDLINKVNDFLNEDGLTPQHRVIVGHNIVNFDRKFLCKLWKDYDQVFPASLWLDTMKMMKAYAKKAGLVKPKFNLQASADICGIKKMANIHNAKSDSRQTYYLFQDLVNVKKIDHLLMIEKFVQSDSSNNEFDMSLLDDS